MRPCTERRRPGRRTPPAHDSPGESARSSGLYPTLPAASPTLHACQTATCPPRPERSPLTHPPRPTESLVEPIDTHPRLGPERTGLRPRPAGDRRGHEAPHHPARDHHLDRRFRDGRPGALRRGAPLGLGRTRDAGDRHHARHGPFRRGRKRAQPVDGARPRRPDAADLHPPAARRATFPVIRPRRGSRAVAARRPHPVAAGGGRARAGLARVHCVVRLGLHTLEAHHRGVDADRRSAGRAPAADRLVGRLGRAGPRVDRRAGGAAPVRHHVRLATSPLPRHRMDVPRGLRPRRVPRPASPRARRAPHRSRHRPDRTGGAFLMLCARLAAARARDLARPVFIASIVHLPILLCAMVADGMAHVFL